MQYLSMPVVLVLLSSSLVPLCAADVLITNSMTHLRQVGPREWATFENEPDAHNLEIEFDIETVGDDCTLQLRQQDVKQGWRIKINDKLVGELHRDENDMIVYFSLAKDVVKKGGNVLTVEATSNTTPDDIVVGEMVLIDQNVDRHLGTSRLDVNVIDFDSNEPTPCRITITRLDGALQMTGAKSNDHLAVRPGTIYSSNGTASIPLPPGSYEIFAGRGFEYSLAKLKVALALGSIETVTLKIRREVDTKGYVACDTHVHTKTHSGHGDATVQERMITLAGEGIELPIATDHNVHVDHTPFADEMKVRKYFTPVIGNEVTTKTGHFNVWPINAKATPPDHRSEDWAVTFDNIERTPGVKAIILNHARDIHQGIRPFDPKRFNSAVGVNVDGWKLRANAMEVANSSATQTDVMQLFHDWMTLLNRGHQFTPVGSSDSHDVSRHFVGQGRTYIQCDDRDPGNIDVDMAVDSFLQGRVAVSFGLLAKLTVNDKYGSGELARTPDEKVHVRIEVHAPEWIKSSRVMLFANGVLIREEETTVSDDRVMPLGLKWVGAWDLPKPKHDVHLVAIAIGPGINGSYWKTAKAYQPSSDVWTPQFIGCSGAVWLDVDADGLRTAAVEYAARVFATSKGDLDQSLELLKGYDEAVAAQVAHLLEQSRVSIVSPAVQQKVNSATDSVKAGFRRYLEAWRETQKS